MSALIRTIGPLDLPQVRGIFFESSSKKDFKDEQEREAFYYKYLGFYLKHFPDYCFVAQDKRILGYVVASPVTVHPDLLTIQTHLMIFKSSFEKYPAHLHINCHSESRGKGIGSQLVNKIEGKLCSNNINGLHIMTGADAENKSFYKKLGFVDEVMEEFNGSKILLMGKRLSENRL